MRNTLADFFEDLASARGEFLVHDDGFRTRRYSYAEVAAAARRFAGRLHDAGLRKGDTVLIWSENRPEWIAAFWGCVITGVVVVPIDFRSSLEFASRVAATVGARVALVGDDVEEAKRDATPTLGGALVWRLGSFDWAPTGRSPPPAGPSRSIATTWWRSSSRRAPRRNRRASLITHRNLLANIVPIEREVLKYRRWGRPFFPLRFLNLLPLSHMFGQAMATFIPPMLPGTTIFMRGYNPAEIVAQVKKRRVSVVVSVPKILDVLADHVRRAMPGARASPPHRRTSTWRAAGGATARSTARSARSSGASSSAPPRSTRPPRSSGRASASSSSRATASPKPRRSSA